MSQGMHTERRDFLEWLGTYDILRGQQRLLDEIEALISEAWAAEIEAQADVNEIAGIAAERMLMHLEVYYSQDILQAEFDEDRAAGWQRAANPPLGMLTLMYEAPAWWRRLLRLAPGIDEAKAEVDRFAEDSLYLESCVIDIARQVVYSFAANDGELEVICARLCEALGRREVSSPRVAREISHRLNQGFLQRMWDPYMAKKRALDAEGDREMAGLGAR